MSKKNNALGISPQFGDGSEKTPFQISSLETLFWIAEDPSRWGYNYIQTADINAIPTKTWFDGKGWKPIGNSSAAFTGIYNGNGKCIDGLLVNRSGNKCVGLFGRLGEYSLVDRLGLTNATVTGDSYVGALVGDNDLGTVSFCYSSGKICGTNNIGGLVGENRGTISTCYSSGCVRGSYRIGGLAGENAGIVSACINTSNVNALTGVVGGLVGYNTDTIVSCSSTGSVKGTDCVGGLVGYNS
ncbi:MAG: hypothetical protein Q4F84_01410 [Fibrobacter sp.]|nr:hypothetical protein [Fibrobacter sp.]